MTDRIASTTDGSAIPLNQVQGKQHSRSGKSERPRTTQGEAAIWTQSADLSTTLEVDILILDYIAYNTTTGCLTSRQPDISRPVDIYTLEASIRTTNAFLLIFHARHANSYVPDAELRFRIQLLKFVTLFTQRLTNNVTTPSAASLAHLREINHQRAKRWHARQQSSKSKASSAVPLQPPNNILPSEDTLARNRAHVLHTLAQPAEDELYSDAHYGTAASLSLLDLLPLFMRVSALRNAMSNSNLTEMWMQMAGEFMLQACLEQYLVVGVTGNEQAEEILQEAFAWGWIDKSDAAAEGGDGNGGRGDGEGEGEDEEEINDMFSDTTYETEVEGWAETKSAYMDLLSPPLSSSFLPLQQQQYQDDGQHWLQHLETLATTHPIQSFEATVHTFLLALAASIPLPILAQLEQGEALEGMSREETKEFLVGCGIGDGTFPLFSHQEEEAQDKDVKMELG